MRPSKPSPLEEQGSASSSASHETLNGKIKPKSSASRWSGEWELVLAGKLAFDVLDQHSRDLFFAHFGPVFDGFCGNQVHPVAVTSHYISRYVIRHDPVGPLAGPLGNGLLDDALGFSRESDE